MKKRNTPRRLIIVPFCIMLIATTKGFSAPPDSSYKHHLPRMWVTNSTTPTDHYKHDRKHVMETEYSGQPDQFLLKGWMNMVEYLKIQHPLYTCLRAYLCAYNAGKKVPVGQKNRLVVVFVPTTIIDEDHATELGYYFIPDNDSFSVANISRFTIDKTDFQDWSSHYFAHFLAYMSKDIDNSNSDNQNRDQTYTDTWCIAYCRSSIQELIKEKKYIHTDKSNTKRITISQNILFSLATQQDVSPNGRKRSGRLFYSIDFTDNKHAPVYLDDMFGFSKRKTADVECDECGTGYGILDNGQLCPPASNCPGGR